MGGSGIWVCQWVAPGNIQQISSVSTETAFYLGLMLLCGEYLQ